VTLRAADGGELPGWAPGSHIDLVLPNNVMRQYSLCGDPRDTSTYRIGVLLERDGRGGSVYVHDELREGDRVEIRGPRNHFELEPAQRYRFVAGGVGITPILPMVADAHRRGADWELLYLARSEEEVAFRTELEQYPAERVRIQVTTGGRPTLDEIVGEPGSAVYACGPARLLDALEEHAATREPGSLHVERFEPDLEQLAAPTEGFQVVLTESALTLDVAPDRSILDVVEEAGIAWPYSCREGTCGTCETRIVAGAADHRDAILSPAEKDSNEYMMICVSRAAGPRLELEI